MDRKVERLAEILGIRKERLEEAIFQVGSEEGGEEGCGEINEEHFYYNPDLFARLVKPNMSKLASLVIPDLSRLRR